MNNIHRSDVLLSFSFFVLGIIIGFGISHSSSKNTAPVVVNETKSQYIERAGGYTFINPLLDASDYAPSSNENTKKLHKEVQNEINTLKSKQKVKDFSIYYRDLVNGPWFGIEENKTFTPASLLKVPVMIAYFSLSEDDPTVLDKQLRFVPEEKVLPTNSYKLPEDYQPKERLVPNEIYTVRDLIARMIIFSDNDSLDTLMKDLPTSHLADVHDQIKLTFPNSSTPQDYLSVKSYSSMFRMLYNSSYLSRHNSEEALSILAASTYDIGIAKGVPEDVYVANKYGVRTLNQTDGNVQLHDCGIVYHPKSPYIICIMTRGESLDELADSIATVSELVYKSVTGE